MMNLEDVTALLTTLKEPPIPDRRITCLRYIEESHKSWGADYSKLYLAREHDTYQEAVYHVKYPRHSGPGLLSVVCELVCARIGRYLFSFPLCPPFAIADPLSGTWERGFASKDLVGYRNERLSCIEELNIFAISSINPALLARIIVFHLWLVSYDAELLISENGKEAASIDHGFFLDWQNKHPPANLYAALLTKMEKNEIDQALTELEQVDERLILEQFIGIPSEWREGKHLGYLDGICSKGELAYAKRSCNYKTARRMVQQGDRFH